MVSFIFILPHGAEYDPAVQSVDDDIVVTLFIVFEKIKIRPFIRFQCRRRHPFLIIGPHDDQAGKLIVGIIFTPEHFQPNDGGKPCLAVIGVNADCRLPSSKVDMSHGITFTVDQKKEFNGFLSAGIKGEIAAGRIKVAALI